MLQIALVTAVVAVVMVTVLILADGFMVRRHYDRQRARKRLTQMRVNQQRWNEAQSVSLPSLRAERDRARMAQQASDARTSYPTAYREPVWVDYPWENTDAETF